MYNGYVRKKTEVLGLRFVKYIRVNLRVGFVYFNLQCPCSSSNLLDIKIKKMNESTTHPNSLVDGRKQTAALRTRVSFHMHKPSKNFCSVLKCKLSNTNN